MINYVNLVPDSVAWKKHQQHVLRAQNWEAGERQRRDCRMTMPYQRCFLTTPHLQRAHMYPGKLKKSLLFIFTSISTKENWRQRFLNLSTTDILQQIIFGRSLFSVHYRCSAASSAFINYMPIATALLQQSKNVSRLFRYVQGSKTVLNWEPVL